ncbi:putative epidermal cell surface receptor isoform X2 [Agrilus planipennis]|uniref:Epidermal cell surface receptor isoform X2 n=1 Tax=Agrilus planipennis TaxID=224129 RepID=A0A1W4WES1_AGRPL|nr:putative epidermal cell surface receptor isoform X2 [Agrilus planipennis]
MKWTKMNLRFVYVFVVLFLCCVFCTGSFIEIPECTGKEGCLIPTKNLTDPDFEGMIIYGTEKPVPPPEALSMLSEDENHEVEYAPTDPTMMSTSTSGNVSDEPKGRALNFSVEPGQDNKISKSTTSGKVKDLSDVSMDDEEEEGDQEKVTVSSLERNMTRLGICMLGGLTYENGEKLEHACDSVCTCANGKMDCVDRCVHPYVKKGSKPTDPLCTEKSSDDPCCSTWFCASDIETEPFEMCTYKNKTYQRSEKFEDGCQSVCHCEAAGKVTCRPRCPEMEHKTTDRCVEVPDQSDPCCKKLLCDVTLDDNESEKDDKFHPKILTASLVNKTAIRIKFNSIVDENNLPEVQLSTDKMSWKTYKLKPEGLLSGFQEDPKYVKIHGSSEIVEITKTENSEDAEASGGHQSCEYKGKMYKLNEEFNDNCTSFCVCKNSGVHCLKIECPTYFGVDVLDPTCVEWQTVPEDFVPSPPNCCPKEVRCKNNGSCSYAGEIYTNWQEIPSNVTGCEKKCYCEMGKIECQNICPPVTAFPPANIGCPQHEATLSHLAGDDCCMYWICNSTTTNSVFTGGQIFSGFPNIPPNGMHRNQDEIVVHSVEAVDAHTIRLEFSVPPIIVGLHGQVEVRYTSKLSDQLDDWNLQVFTPPDEYISTPQMEFDLLGLEADTEYKIKITVILRGLHNTPTSEVYNVRTPKETGASLPPMIPIDPKLEITDVNSTWVTVIWRKFADQELQLIDGIQLRYKEIDGKIYQATPLIHRMVTTYTLDHLKPNTKYEVGIFFIPFEGQTSELHYEHMLHFTTANEVDTYGFNVTLEITNIKATSVEITWYGVPYPQDKYVNIYRAIYQTPSGKGDFSTFKIAKRDSTPKTIIKDLNPRTKYRLWLEVYLTNGKIKTSNVKDFTTKSSPYPPKPSQIVAGELFDAEMSKQNKSDYYGALVVVAIIAALAIVSTVVLLMVLFKRHSQKKAAITAPSQRVSQSAYDNPTYKVEIQQETMGMSTIK